ncbi:ribonuclease H-like protein, partial [Coprinopsis sp. MPI-PUGE-AT-0042]
VTAYTDGSCTGNGTSDARAGSGVWYARGDERNKALRVPDHLASNNAGELLAILVGLNDNATTKQTNIISDSQYAIEAATKHIHRNADRGFIGIKNKEILWCIYDTILTTDNETYLEKVKGHSGNEGNDGADALAAEGANQEEPDDFGLEANDTKRLGARMYYMTKSLLYRGIQERTPRPDRKGTNANIETIMAHVGELNEYAPTEEAIWRSVVKTQDATLTRKASAFLWKTIHNGHKIGKFWAHTQLAEEFMPCKHCDAPVESMQHILMECGVSGQTHIWETVKTIWNRTGLQWPQMSIGTLMGIGVVNIRDGEGNILTGPTRLYRILISEAVHQIWCLRCNWRIGHDQDRNKIPSKEMAEAQWLFRVNKRLRHDRVLANEKKFGGKALSRYLVASTWEPLLQAEMKNGSLPPDWVTNYGVLVGIETSKRPPGRNR